MTPLRSAPRVIVKSMVYVRHAASSYSPIVRTDQIQRLQCARRGSAVGCRSTSFTAGDSLDRLLLSIAVSRCMRSPGPCALDLQSPMVLAVVRAACRFALLDTTAILPAFPAHPDSLTSCLTHGLLIGSWHRTKYELLTYNALKKREVPLK